MALQPLIEWLRWELTHDRTQNSLPSRFVLRKDIEAEIRKLGGGGTVTAVFAWLYDEGFLREPTRKWETVDHNGQRRIHDAAELFGAHVEITSRCLSTEEATGPPAESSDSPQYVTLDQMAARVNRSKKSLEKKLNDHKSTMPRPDSEGGGGKPHEWIWSNVRPWLESEYGKNLPERLPSRRADGN